MIKANKSTKTYKISVFESSESVMEKLEVLVAYVYLKSFLLSLLF